MKVAIIELPYHSLLGLPVEPGLGAGYVASFLEEAGHSVSMINGEALRVGLLDQIIRQPLDRLRYYLSPSFKQFPPLYKEVMTNSRHYIWDNLIEQIRSEAPDVVGLGLVTVKMTGAKIICQRIKKELGDIPIVLGGIHPTSVPAETLNGVPEADFVVVGEGEETARDLLQYLGAPREFELRSIRGLAYRDKYGAPVVNEPRAFIQNLDSLPFPKREASRGKISRASVITGRGCPFRCEFCASHVIWKRRIRYRSIHNVLEEISMLKSLLGVTRVNIVDDTFTLSKKRVLEFSQGVRKRGLDSIEYLACSRVDTVDSEMLRALKACGVKVVQFGVESGSPRILREIGKDITPRQVMKAVALANAEGMESRTFYMIGHPGETRQDIRLSKKLARQSKAVHTTLAVVTIYPQTGYAKIAAAKNKKPLSINDYYKGFHQSTSTVNLSGLTDEELELECKSFISLIRRLNLKYALLNSRYFLIRLRQVARYLFRTR
jgi:radical SAM superfamily enzyme YgiQ (UPF0313 family)